MSKQIYSTIDRYTRLAHTQNYPARSVYKLKYINDKYHILKPQYKVLDLGCSPGSWYKYCIEQCTSGSIIGIDRTYVDINRLINNSNHSMQCNYKFIHSDIYQWNIPDEYRHEYFDVVLSDMAPNTTGNKSYDTTNAMELILKTINLAQSNILKKHGTLLLKYFQCEYDQQIISQLHQYYHTINTIKPDASRKNSTEMFILARGKK